jgi:hypothetical protein
VNPEPDSSVPDGGPVSPNGCAWIDLAVLALGLLLILPLLFHWTDILWCAFVSCQWSVVRC